MKMVLQFFLFISGLTFGQEINGHELLNRLKSSQLEINRFVHGENSLGDECSVILIRKKNISKIVIFNNENSHERSFYFYANSQIQIREIGDNSKDYTIYKVKGKQRILSTIYCEDGVCEGWKVDNLTCWLHSA